MESIKLGEDEKGREYIITFSQMPHLLVAGVSGSGKSTLLNHIILRLIQNDSPKDTKLLLIDTSMVELSAYNGIPHLCVPVVTEPKRAAGALKWLVAEILRRYRLFSEVGVRDLAGYNAILRQNDNPSLPQVVIIIDELADLMMVASKEVEESICRVAQMGRAAGVNMFVATRQLSPITLTKSIRAGIPSRAAFMVRSSRESRLILDQGGAENLLSSGEMLFSTIGIADAIKLHCELVTDEEREKIIDFVKREAGAEYSNEILAEIEKTVADRCGKGGSEKEEEAALANDYDELLPQAVDVIFETKQASVSILQRRLKLGYSRAARLIDQMEEVGVVGPYEGSKPREIMLTKQQWQEMQYFQDAAPVDTIMEEFSTVAEVAASPQIPDDEVEVPDNTDSPRQDAVEVLGNTDYAEQDAVDIQATDLHDIDGDVSFRNDGLGKRKNTILSKLLTRFQR